MGQAAEAYSVGTDRKAYSVQRMGNVVAARFHGRLDVMAGQASAQEFLAAVGKDSVKVLFDIRNMDGYDSGARTAWATALKPISNQLREIEILGGNSLVRMGGSVLGAVIGVPVRFT